MSAVTAVVVVSASAMPPILPMGWSRAATGSHWMSSGKTTPLGCSTVTIIAIVLLGISPGMKGQMITWPVAAAR